MASRRADWPMIVAVGCQTGSACFLLKRIRLPMMRIGEGSLPRTAVRRLIVLFLIATGMAVVALRSAPAQVAPKPPAQPVSGPGGAECTHNQVVAKMYGTGPARYWIFEPADPKPESAPVVLFNHGWGAMEPKVYGAWIDHIVKRGNIVVYPVYQASLRTPIRDFTSNAAAGIRSAIDTLQSEPGHVRPQLDKVAVVGHSMGGVIAANLGAEWKKLGIPQPSAVMCVEPGKTWTASALTSVKLANMSLIGKDTLLLAVAGDRDRLVKDVDAKRIFKESTNVLPQNKNYVVLISDEHGSRPLIANHAAPVAFNPIYTDSSVASGLGKRLRARMEERSQDSGDDSLDLTEIEGNSIDALDIYGTWKLFDGLADAAFYGRNREYALGDTPPQRFMGNWSDGTPVKELQVTEAP
jgi:pimeloyl-ACP methyl ester carboxylesterase